MDSLTHIALGACIGELLLGKKIGKKALFLGAFSQSIPDLDFVAAFWLKPEDNLLAHRGFTHSILFALLLASLLSFFMKRWFSKLTISPFQWFGFIGIQLLTHIFLDAFNTYGVGWFEPFSHTRISFNMLYVADPFFSIWTGVGFLILLIGKQSYKFRYSLSVLVLVLSGAYLLHAINNKLNTDSAVKRELANAGISYKQYFTTPAPLNNWLWFIVAANDSGYYIGYRSVFTKSPSTAFSYFPKNDSLLAGSGPEVDTKKLVRFSQGWYTLEKRHDTLIFNDLRFGQVIGWQNPKERFVFHYFLNKPESNKLVMQRGRFEKWDRESIHSLIRKIYGY